MRGSTTNSTSTKISVDLPTGSCYSCRRDVIVVMLTPQTEKDALCTNINEGKPGPHCIVNSWPSEGDLYIKGQAGPVEAITFSLEASRLNTVNSK